MDNTLTQAPVATPDTSHAELIRRFSSDDALFSLVKQAVHEAVIDHKHAGNPVAGSVDGKVVIFQPEDI